MTRLQQFQREVNEVQSKCLRLKMPEPKMVDASFCSDIPNSLFSASWSHFKIITGSISLASWIKANGFAKCKKPEATCFLMVGEKTEAGYFISGKYKTTWLKPINN